MLGEHGGVDGGERRGLGEEEIRLGKIVGNVRVPVASERSFGREGTELDRSVECGVRRSKGNLWEKTTRRRD